MGSAFLVLCKQCLLAWLVLALGGYPGTLGPPDAKAARAKVSIERIGPQGTSAEDRPGSFGVTLAVTLTLRQPRWAAGRHYLRTGPGSRGSIHLSWSPKRVSLGWGNERIAQKRAELARCRGRDRLAILRAALSLAWLVLALGNPRTLGPPCGGEAKVSIERIGPQGTSAEDRTLPNGLVRQRDPRLAREPDARRTS